MGLRHFKVLLFVFLPLISNGQSFHTLMSNYQIVGEAAAFVFTIDTDLGVGDYFKIPTVSSGTYNCTVDWGDLSTSEITSWDDPDTTHYYSSGGAYTVSITGTMTHWSFNNDGEKDKFTALTSFGDVGLVNLQGGFFGCQNVSGAIPSFPSTLTTLHNSSFRVTSFSSVDLSGITIIDNIAFYNSASFSGDLIIPLSITSVGYQSFQNTTFDGDLKIYSYTFDEYSFYDMDNLDNIYLYNTSLTAIPAHCFQQSILSGAFYIYATTAPTVGTGGVNLENTPVLHVPSGATGYDVSPWTTEFSSVVYDL